MEEFCRGRRRSSTGEAGRLAWRLPLAHSRSPGVFLWICENGVLLSRRQLVDRGLRKYKDSTETRLGTDNRVFTYCGPARYPGRGCAFLFRAEVEAPKSDGAVATPFDSGGIVDHYLPGATQDEQRDFLSQHELPVTDYRGLVEAFLRCSFQSPRDYVTGVAPESFPSWVRDRRTPLGWIFEVGIESELAADIELLAVFVDLETTNRNRFKKFWASVGAEVDLVIYDASSRPDDEVAALTSNYILESNQLN